MICFHVSSISILFSTQKKVRFNCAILNTRLEAEKKNFFFVLLCVYGTDLALQCRKFECWSFCGIEFEHANIQLMHGEEDFYVGEMQICEM